MLYGPTGDRLSAALDGAFPMAYVYAVGTHHLASVSGVARSYDANGNTQTGVAGTWAYDDKNRLSSVTRPAQTAGYLTNGRGERVSKTATTIGAPLPTTGLYSYDESGQLLGEYSSGGVAQAEYIYLDAQPVAVVKGAALAYVETDHLGTPRQVAAPTTNAPLWT